MSLSNFVSVMLNINEEIIQDIREPVHSDNSVTINIKLKIISKQCLYCRKNAKIHGYTPKKLIHSALANRKCTIVTKTSAAAKNGPDVRVCKGLA